MKHVFLTDHAKERLAERTTISPKNYQWYVDQAFEKGLDSCMFKEPMKSYLESLCHDQGQFVAKVYGGRVYIFNNDHGSRLLTVYDLEDQYRKVDDYKIHTNEYLNYCIIKLTEKKSGKEYFWSVNNNLTTDLEDAAEFKNQISANKFIYNNFAFDYYLDDYSLEII